MTDDPRPIYSPESSDGTPDWPSRLGIAAMIVLATAVLAGVLWVVTR